MTPKFATDFDNPSHVRGPINVGSAPYWPLESTELLPCRTKMFIAPYLYDKDTEMESETDIETEINRKWKRQPTIHRHGHRCGHGHGHEHGIGALFAKYSIWRNICYRAVRVASDMSQRNFQKSYILYILVAPLHDKKMT
jgi:hypothetical protein